MTLFPPFRLDLQNQCLWRGDARIPLMPKPFAVLQYLVEHPGRLVTHDELLAAIWPDTYVQPEVLRRYILEIRRALDDPAAAPRYVETLPKRGYQFVAAVSEALPSSSAPRDLQAAFVGRTAALAALAGHLTAARQGMRRVVFVTGEAGIGKTRLVDEFLDDAASMACSPRRPET